MLWVRTQLARHGLTLADLVAASCFAPVGRTEAAPTAVRYRSADDGAGEMPDWLRRAVNAGQSVEHFRLGLDRT
ncbi:H-NS histone family protein (plasmid) [Cupriavidus sp. KK10]|nr:H-NS histone family protein [Cupriavidus sp. KK10]QUN32631.1 H-NS histone family protein [Cupriavidus sp. KK10]